MTTTAGDIRYGRRGGGWLPSAAAAGVEPGICHTCRTGRARWVATSTERAESWPVCGSCRDQGARLRAALTYEPLDLAVPVEQGPELTAEAVLC